MFCLGLGAQDFQDIGFEANGAESAHQSPTEPYEAPLTIDTSFEEAAEKNEIAYRSFSGLEDVENGYYLIGSVFSNPDPLKKTLKKLRRKGFENAGYIHNENNGLNYVYLEYFPFGLEAIDAYRSQLDGRYNNDMWILEIENSMAIGGNDMAVDEMEGPAHNMAPAVENSDEGGKEELPVAHPPLSENTGKSKLVERADAYFDKMWYAEAAQLYEQALSKGDKHFTKENVQKAADAYYFNTDMENAYKWYNVLYENYGKAMSADNLFKYSHSLKGTGKYARSKRLMRLYNRKVKEETDAATAVSDARQDTEAALDNILDLSQNIEIKNLGINTEYSDFSPMFLDSTQVVFASAKDSSFLTTRRYKWNNQPYLDLYVAQFNKESQDLRNTVKLSKEINTKYHEASVTFSPDNKTMYFTRNNYGKKLKRDSKGVNHLKIYKSTKEGDKWSEAVEVSFNSDNYSTGHPALSPDGKKLFFVSDMPGSLGETDLFVVDVLEDGSFSEPRNLGKEINTEHREMFPFFDGSKLYFSSDGHIGLGGLDVYESVYDEKDGFQEIKNLGKPVNSNKDDFSYIVDNENEYGFFASNREGGKGDDDIYSFKRLSLEETPVNQNAIAGVVTELVTGEFMPQTLVQLLDENGIKLKEVVTEDDGSFVFEDLESSTKYTLKIGKDKFVEHEMPVATVDNERVEIDIAMKRLEEMIALEDGIKKIKTEMIHFGFDKYDIRPEASKELDKLVSVMKEYPGMVIKIESHTDSRGSKAYNEYLSDKRAKSTRDYIISQGIAPERIESAIGYGESKLLNECDGSEACSEAEHLLNRRSEFIIVKM
ncbi:WD40-like Beta Propeller Repeat [Pseudozobellia thermophila]|uniref:WD40-like Beta Propeller Repeat n=2 Tax=Pseudozobellia thermophila TaxID=192903 RepID=A0A1M6BKE1_9FLAO|nr:WD40-like Beta Propeller Repeat [Pseudozobellia thermophila]